MMSDKHLDIFDKFLDDMTNSKITNKDYAIIHKIFDKYLSKKVACKIQAKQHKERRS